MKSKRSGSDETTALLVRGARGGALLLSCTLAAGFTAVGTANAAVDPAQCVDRFGSPGMVSYWTFDDAADPGKDDAGHSNGLLIDGAQQVAAGQKVGAGAMRFSGGTDHLELDYAAFRKASTDSFTVSAWFQAKDLSGKDGMNIFGVGAPCGPDNGTFAWTMLVNPVGATLFSTGRFCEVNNSAPSFPVEAGAWTHAVAVYDAGIMLLYVDGIVRTSDSFILGTTSAPDALIAAIGNNLGDPGTRGFRGLINEVAFFDRALTPEEVAGLYDDSVAGRNYCEPSCFDQDDDGFGSPASRACPGGNFEDCNDRDASIFPGAAESCDGIDNDCDGALPSNEFDEDRDGVRICAGDCNDRNSQTFPGARELFDGEDNDCDGLKDEGVDNDHDGVPNASDACPSTRAGTRVGLNGCPARRTTHDWRREHDSDSDSHDRSGRHDNNSGRNNRDHGSNRHGDHGSNRHRR